jgi:hypothetical protein
MSIVCKDLVVHWIVGNPVVFCVMRKFVYQREGLYVEVDNGVQSAHIFNVFLSLKFVSSPTPVNGEF